MTKPFLFCICNMYTYCYIEDVNADLFLNESFIENPACEQVSLASTNGARLFVGLLI